MSFTIPLARLSLGQRRTNLGCPLVTPECFGKNFRGEHIDTGGWESRPPVFGFGPGDPKAVCCVQMWPGRRAGAVPCVGWGCSAVGGGGVPAAGVVRGEDEE
jgi:hypothetical protein